MTVPGSVFQRHSPDTTGRDNTQEEREWKTGKGKGKRKRRRGRLKENVTQRTTQARTGREATGEGEAKSAGDRATTTPYEDGEGTAGGVSGYQNTTEDLRLREVYKELVHANPGTHLDGGVRDDSAW